MTTNLHRRDLIAGPRTPPWVHALLAPFGTNPFGESIFRVVHSTSRVFTVGGYFEEDGMFKYRRRSRYMNKSCWVLERWLPARHYGSPASWAENTINPEGYLSLGPYPLYGLYECCFMFAPGPLHPVTVSNILKTVYCGRVRKTGDIREEINTSAKMEEALWDEQFERDYDSTHGVRRGLSLTGTGTLVNYNEEVERYKERLVASKVKVKRKDFKPGFAQL